MVLHSYQLALLRKQGDGMLASWLQPLVPEAETVC